ncbi:MAG TPA: hypothetical protein VKA48_04865, partial [Gammaproteobacteria bacterium]|nr:hypothetical protein [Gammaproteobacteria bacterium]
LLILASLLAFLAAGCLNAWAADLCLGRDGHAGYKISLAACCSPLAPPEAPRGGHTIENGGACGPCVDVTFAPAVRSLKDSRTKAPAAGAAPGLSPRSLRLLIAEAASVRSSAGRPAGFSSNAPLVHLATVVLLN